MKERCSCNNSQHTGFSWSPFAKGILTGGITGLLCCVAFSALFAFILLKYDAQPAMVNVFSIAVSVLSSIAAGFTAAKILRKNGLLVGLISAVLLLLILTAIGMCTCGIQLNAGFAIKLTAMCTGGILGGIIGVNLRKPLK